MQLERSFMREKNLNSLVRKDLNFKVSRFRKENSLTASSSFLTNHLVGLLTVLSGPRSKSYLRGKNELGVKTFSVVSVQTRCT